jgi:hypothetical protein
MLVVCHEGNLCIFTFVCKSWLIGMCFIANTCLLYYNPLFVKAIVIMIVRHLHSVHELLSVLAQPTKKPAPSATSVDTSRDTAQLAETGSDT